jgi:hypothetical protein
MTSARTSLGRSGPEGDPDAPLIRAHQRGEPHPPKTPGRERISGLPPTLKSEGGLRGGRPPVDEPRPEGRHR